MSKFNFDFDLPFPDIFLKEWGDTIGPRDFMMFRNLDHFRHTVAQITQKEDDKCGMSYADALKMLMSGETDFPEAEQQLIQREVRENLHKRGLITEEVYENFRYTTDGTQIDVDVGKYANGEPDCILSPSRQYIDFFYELYVSISYVWSINNETIRANVAKLLATIEELERQHIFIKITLVFPDRNVTRGSASNGRRSNFFSTVPLFSHKEYKSVATMSSVVNDRLLRKFFFALLEDTYGDDLASGYGNPTDLEGTLNIGNTFNEVEFFENITKTVGV